MLEAGGGFIQARDLVFYQKALVTLLRNQRQRFVERKLFRQRQVEGDQHFSSSSFLLVLVPGVLILRGGGRERGRRGLPNTLRRILAHRFSAAATVQLRHVRPEDLQVIANLRHRADGRTGGADGVALLDGDGGRNPFDAVHLRFVHAVEELAGIGRKGL